MNEGEAERKLFEELAKHLWWGSLTTPPPAQGLPIRESKARLDGMLSRVMKVREKYHLELHRTGAICDEECNRSVTCSEMT